MRYELRESPSPPKMPPSHQSPSPILGDEFALPRRHSPSNRRANAPLPTKLLIGALILSTLVAALFCVLYITKPVIATTPEEAPTATAPPAELPEETRAIIIDGTDDDPETRRPDKTPRTPTSTSHDQHHEETNLRVQHVLDASTPDGDLSRIVLDVPVIYPSRNLRWTDAEVAQAREILARLADYHEQSRHLRDLGTDILLDWNHLIERSIPASDLRADSPSLPSNQKDSALLPRPTSLDSSESIEIRPSGP